MRKHFFFVLILSILISISSSRTIQVPNQKSDETLHIRLQQLYDADKIFSMFGQLQNIYSMEAVQIHKKKEKPFKYCFQNPPEASFKVKGQHLIGNKNYRRGGVVYNFQQIKYPRNLIDIELYQNRIYYVREDGVIKIASLSNDLSSITQTKQYQTQERKITYGILVILPDLKFNGVNGYGVFITQSQVTLFDLQGKSFKSMSNLQSMAGFTTAIPIEGKYMAVALAAGGVKILSVDIASNQLKLQSKFNSQSSQNSKITNAQDLGYNRQRKILFILDYHVGVVPLSLTLQEASISAKPTSSVISMKGCDVLYYDSYEDDLYINCQQLHKYNINQWPTVAQTVLPRQEISIRDITSSKDTVALVGRNIFQVINLQRKVAIYQDRLLDKLILQGDQFVSGNQNYLMTGKFSVTPPSMYCQALQEKAVGKYTVFFKVTANCNQEFFKTINFNPGDLEKGDKCIYSVYHKVKIWKAIELNVKAFGVIGLIIGILGLGVLIWWGCSFINLRKLKNQWQNYHILNEGQDVQISADSSQKPPEDMVEMKAVSNSQGSKEGHQELNEEVDIPADLHDIE